MSLRPASLPVHNPLTDELLPTQERIYALLKRTSHSVPLVALAGGHGRGQTTLMRRLAEETGAAYLDAQIVKREFNRSPARRAGQILRELIEQGLRRQGAVVFDGYLELLAAIDPRSGAVRMLMQHFGDLAIRTGARLVLGGTDVDAMERRAWFGAASTMIEIDPFDAADYRAFLTARLGDRVAGLDFDLVHDLAPMLDLYQLNELANRLALLPEIDTDSVRRCLEEHLLRTNLKVREVEALSFDRLPGAEHIVDALETHVVMPLENVAMAREFGLTPRRGVLLYGPPGTGKTSIGRALAHRMQGRFFLIDGSVVTEPPSGFFAQIDGIVAQAKANAPCVLFIDDADVLFQIEHVAGLSRYLLSLLDGIESEAASRVCIMMTAMDAGKLPAPLLRSGRIELWLETRLPDADTRMRIVERWLSLDLPGAGDIDYTALVQETEGFTPADLRRLTSDAKLFYAADVAAGRPLRSATAYLDMAVDELRDLRAAMSRHVEGEALEARYYA